MAADEDKTQYLVDLDTTPDPSTQPTWLQRGVRRAALPTMLGATGAGLGAAAGVLTGGAASVPLAIGGEMVGSAAGEYLNQRMGIGGAEKGDYLNLGLAAAGPPLARGVGAVVGMLPGFSAGVQSWMLKTLGPNGERLVDSMTTTGAKASQLWRRVDALQDQMLPSATRQALTEAEAEMGKRVPSLRPSGIQNVVKDLHAWLDPQPFPGFDASRVVGAQGGGAPVVKVSDFNLNRQGLGERLQNLIAAGGEGAGLAKKLYGAMWDDLDTWAANAPGNMSSLFQDAVHATKQKEAADFIQKLFQNAASRPQGIREINVRSIMESIDRNQDVMRRWLAPSEIVDLQDTLSRYARTPLTPGASEAGGVNYVNRALVGGAIGSGIGLLTGHDPVHSAASGIMVGTVGATLISRMLTSPGGRAFVREFAANPRFSGSTGLHAVTNFLEQTARGAVVPQLGAVSVGGGSSLPILEK
jgi:hypothetical protein